MSASWCTADQVLDRADVEAFQPDELARAADRQTEPEVLGVGVRLSQEALSLGKRRPGAVSRVVDLVQPTRHSICYRWKGLAQR
jgi:hypothetical protein